MKRPNDRKPVVFHFFWKRGIKLWENASGRAYIRIMIIPHQSFTCMYKLAKFDIYFVGLNVDWDNKLV